jgi:hypothetical protein
MKSILCLAVALTATIFSGTSQAQVTGGTGCGGCGGWNSYYGYNFNHSGFERPPYFALFPPVYYSDVIVPRPVGISPFAAPPGVVPAEMIALPPQPATVKNPYFRPEARPVAETEPQDAGT